MAIKIIAKNLNCETKFSKCFSISLHYSTDNSSVAIGPILNDIKGILYEIFQPNNNIFQKVKHHVTVVK